MKKQLTLIGICVGGEPPHSVAIDAHFQPVSDWGDPIGEPSVARFAMVEMSEHAATILHQNGESVTIRGDTIADAFLKIIEQFADRAPERNTDAAGSTSNR